MESIVFATLSRLAMTLGTNAVSGLALSQAACSSAESLYGIAPFRASPANRMTLAAKSSSSVVCRMFAPFVGMVGGTSIVQRKRVGAIADASLRPDDWQDIWPELVASSAECPPALAHQAQAAINSEAKEAAHA